MEKKKAIQEFMSNLESIHDPDFGDFKRKCGNYIARLAPFFLEDDKAFEFLKDLKHYVIFDDNLRNPDEVKFYIEHKISQLEARA